MSLGSVGESLQRYQRHAEFGTFFTGRYRCRYSIWGQGPTLVLVHGLADRAKSFAPLMDRLYPSFRCITYDLPDGTDGAKLASYRHRDYVYDLLALLDHLGERKVRLYGSSFGSTVVLSALDHQEERFVRAVLQGGFAHRPLHWAERALAAFTRYLPGRLGEMPGRATILEKNDRPMFYGAPLDAWDMFVRHSGELPNRAVACRALLLHRVDLRRRLAHIQHPILLIGGDRDTLVPKSCELELLAGLPRATRVEFPQCGHFPQYTHPDALARSILEFLKKT